MGYTQDTNHSKLHTDQGEVFNVLWYLKKQGYSEHTINFVRKALIRIQNGCNFTDPDAVKVFIAKLDVVESYKRNLCYAYDHFPETVRAYANHIEKSLNR